MAAPKKTANNTNESDGGWTGTVKGLFGQLAIPEAAGFLVAGASAAALIVAVYSATGVSPRGGRSRLLSPTTLISAIVAIVLALVLYVYQEDWWPKETQPFNRAVMNGIVLMYVAAPFAFMYLWNTYY